MAGFVPKAISTIGRVPGKGFGDMEDPYKLTKVGVITRVDYHNMKCDVRVLSGGTDLYECDITQAMSGPRSFLGGIPEVNSLVVIGYRRKGGNIYEGVILGYIPVGITSGLRFDPFSGINPDEVDPEDTEVVEKLFGKTTRLKRIMGRPGDVMGMSSSGAEWHLSKDVRITNRAGDLFELRDVDRTMVTQAIHHVHNDSAAYIFSGAIRRGAMNLPLDIFKAADPKADPTTPAGAGRIVRDTKDRYFGRDDLSVLGPKGQPFIDPTTGAILDRINDETEFPSLTYSNGRQVFYPSEIYPSNFEGVDGPGEAYTERRVEIRHKTDLRQSVLEEIDAFTPEPSIPYIEQVMGTVVGNDPYSSGGQRQYAKILRPQIFTSFDDLAASTFTLEEVLRDFAHADQVDTMTGAMLLRMIPPHGKKEIPFGVGVSKQGKLFLNLPGSIEEGDDYGAKNVSAEVNMEGALKIRFGAATPSRQSIHLVCEGGIFLDIGADQYGNSLTQTFRGAVKHEYVGTNNTEDVAHSVAVQGNDEYAVTGSVTQTINGSVNAKISGGYDIEATNLSLKGLNGFTGTFGTYNLTASGKSQWQFAQAVLETITTGGRVSTILAGGEIKNILAGGESHVVTAGGFTVAVAAGAVSIAAAAGAVSLTGGAAMTVAAGAAMAITAGAAMALSATAAMTLTAGPLMTLTAAQILLGGPTAIFGVMRSSLPVPPGTPTLDPITGLPMMSSSLVRAV